MFNFRAKIFILLIFIVSYFPIIEAQPVEIKNSAEIYTSLQKLKVLGSVLYIAAHPDDENTGMIAYLSKGKKFRTAYLSLTRGDGGQNLIGSEKGNAIGIIRTQELIEARKIDGGEQYFTRAVDFGYSKSADETFNIWNKEEVLADVVWVIRDFKPDIIITRFPPGESGGHGHHTASAILALEAFHKAADPNSFKEQLQYVEPWTTKRIFWNSWRPTQDEIQKLIGLDIGEYDHHLGKSYTEISAESRSMHKSQGFGATPSRGSRIDYLKFIDGEPVINDYLDGINISWSRINNGEQIEKRIEKIISSYNHSNPSESLNLLIELYKELNKLGNNYWADVKKKELIGIIKSSAGLWLEAIASDYSSAPGYDVNVKTTIINRSSNKFKVNKIEFPNLQYNSSFDSKLEYNIPFSYENKISIPDNFPFSQPYWLIDEPSIGLFATPEQTMIGMAENSPTIPVKISLDYGGVILDFIIPLLYRWNDRVEGELYRPFEIRPPVTANVRDKVSIFPDEKTKEIQVVLKSSRSNVEGEIHLHANGDWKIIPSTIPFSIKNKYDEQVILFNITPPKYPDVVNLKVEVNINGKEYNKSLVEISYPHIQRQVYFPNSDIKLVKLDVKKFESKIGYIVGSGDEISECLTNMGYEVTLLTDEMLEKSDLSQFNTIITGIRAYNTRERIKFYQPRLLEYVNNGGTLIVQYNVSFGLQTNNIGPYPFTIGNRRITDEQAPLNFIDGSHRLINFPNKITQKDFDGWVQERGLYFAENWDDKFVPILSGNDPGESELKGGLLVAEYGKGVFIYSGLAWFRQLPAGVPGAYRIFVNMISGGMFNE